jgi:hypothetical protein
MKVKLGLHGKYKYLAHTCHHAQLKPQLSTMFIFIPHHSEGHVWGILPYTLPSTMAVSSIGMCKNDINIANFDM